MLYRTNSICSEGHKELGGNRISTDDFNWPKSIAYHMTLCGRSFEGDGSSSSSLPVQAGHRLEGSEQLLVYHLLYTFLNIDIDVDVFINY